MTREIAASENASGTAGYTGLDASVYEMYGRSTLPAAGLASLAAHIVLIVGPLIAAWCFGLSTDRRMELSTVTATSRAFDVQIKRPRPQAPKKEDSNKVKPSEGANVKHISRFNSDVLLKNTASIWNSIVYPRMARKMGWQGRVKIRAIISPEGQTLEASIHKSSGYGVLDKAALQGVLQHRWTPGDKTETVIAPFHFKLNEQQ